MINISKSINHAWSSLKTKFVKSKLSNGLLERKVIEEPITQDFKSDLEKARHARSQSTILPSIS